MAIKPVYRMLSAALALCILVPAVPGTTHADDRRDRRHHHADRHGDRHAERNRYIEKYYQRNGHDRDYRRWERNRGRWSDRDYRRWYQSRRHDHDDDNNKAIIAGLFGLAAGAMLGGALSQQQQQPAPSYGTPAYPRDSNYCASRFRSYNPQTGTYRGYDGRDHPCP